MTIVPVDDILGKAWKRQLCSPETWKDLVLDLQVSQNSLRRLTKQLESKRKESEALHQRLLDVRPDAVRAMLSQVLDLTLVEILQRGAEKPSMVDMVGWGWRLWRDLKE